jgi:hypothetical protein
LQTAKPFLVRSCKLRTTEHNTFYEQYGLDKKLSGYTSTWSYGNLKYKIYFGIDIIKDPQGNEIARLRNNTILNIIKL